jgi:hypothetical protein
LYTATPVRRVHLTFDDLGRLAHGNAIRRVSRGYRVSKVLVREAEKVSVQWPKWSVKKWLVNCGYKTYTDMDKTCTKEHCRNPHQALYQLGADNFTCETCLAEQHRLVQPAVIAQPLEMVEPATTAPAYT